MFPYLFILTWAYKIKHLPIKQTQSQSQKEKTVHMKTDYLSIPSNCLKA